MVDRPDDPQIAAIVVAYKSSDTIAACLEGVLGDARVANIVVVDNSSDAATKAVVDAISHQDPRVQYFDPGANLGFAMGCNAGARRLVDWTHVFFVNPDVRPTRPLSELLSHLNGRSEVVVAGRLKSPGHPRSVNARPLVTKWREFRTALIGSRAYGFRGTVNAAGLSAITVPQVDGALLGMHSSTFEVLGGFDEQFELYYEDVDICARAARLGGCLLVPTQWGIHAGGVSSGRALPLSYCLGRISRIRYLRKQSRYSIWAAIAIGGIAITEFVARSLTRQPEGIKVRTRSVAQQIRELVKPQSVFLLDGRPSPAASLTIRGAER